jgi:mannose-6-phosphate isomerase-like protein (cupin superfamily)
MSETKNLPKDYDYLAPDGSEIRLLLNTKGQGVCHCALPPDKVSAAVKHKTVEEIWYFLSGEGEVWRSDQTKEEITRVKSGVCITIPLGTSFQFRNTGKVPLEFIIATTPPWPGKEEAIQVQNHWPQS